MTLNKIQQRALATAVSANAYDLLRKPVEKTTSARQRKLQIVPLTRETEYRIYLLTHSSTKID